MLDTKDPHRTIVDTWNKVSRPPSLTTLWKSFEKERKQQDKSLHNKNNDRGHATGYNCFRGWDIQNEENKVPVLNDGFSLEFSLSRIHR